MSTIATVFVVVIVVLILLVIGNLVFSIIAERKNPPAGKFIECDGVRVHYREWGDAAAPCVVLFHGNGTMIQDFSISGLVDLLAQRNRVLCFDRPGFGHSQRPRSRIWTPSAQAALFVKALKQIGARDPVVVGHSWGTLVAVALGLRGDYSVRSLVLASGYYFPTWRLDVWLLSGPAVPIMGDLLRYTVAPIISLAMVKVHTVFFSSQPSSRAVDSGDTRAVGPPELRSPRPKSAADQAKFSSQFFAKELKILATPLTAPVSTCPYVRTTLKVRNTAITDLFNARSKSGSSLSPRA
jgi:pimeloyl-ACP methyl ester carboxylesterase